MHATGKDTPYQRNKHRGLKLIQYWVPEEAYDLIRATLRQMKMEAELKQVQQKKGRV